MWFQLQVPPQGHSSRKAGSFLLAVFLLTLMLLVLGGLMPPMLIAPLRAVTLLLLEQQTLQVSPPLWHGQRDVAFPGSQSVAGSCSLLLSAANLAVAQTTAAAACRCFDACIPAGAGELQQLRALGVERRRLGAMSAFSDGPNSTP